LVGDWEKMMRQGNQQSSNQQSNSVLMPTDLELLAATVQRRQLTTPLLLLLASHNPLAFVAGQLLYAIAPLGLLLGWESVTRWAALLSAPDATRRLTILLTPPDSTTPNSVTPDLTTPAGSSFTQVE
jgi:hypothetical protein